MISEIKDLSGDHVVLRRNGAPVTGDIDSASGDVVFVKGNSITLRNSYPITQAITDTEYTLTDGSLVGVREKPTPFLQTYCDMYIIEGETLTRLDPKILRKYTNN